MIQQNYSYFSNVGPPLNCILAHNRQLSRQVGPLPNRPTTKVAHPYRPHGQVGLVQCQPTMLVTNYFAVLGYYWGLAPSNPCFISARASNLLRFSGPTRYALTG